MKHLWPQIIKVFCLATWMDGMIINVAICGKAQLKLGLHVIAYIAQFDLETLDVRLSTHSHIYPV